MKATEQYFLVVPFIMVYKVVLTFESVDEILWCDHSNESHWANVTSLAVLSDVVSSFKAFYKMTIWNLAKLTLATSGSEKLNPCQDRPTRRVMNYSKKKRVVLGVARYPRYDLVFACMWHITIWQLHRVEYF